MLVNMHVIENNRTHHSETMSFIIIASSVNVWTIWNLKGLFYQILAKHWDLLYISTILLTFIQDI